MNQQQRYKYSAKHIRRMKLFERQHLKPVAQALLTQIKPVAAILRSDGPEAALRSLDTLHINSHLAPPIKDIYATVGLYFANKTIHDLRQSEKKGVGSGFNPQFLKDILTFFARYILNKAVLPISETMRKLIEDTINYGMEQGYGADRVASALESPDFTLTRARLVVRTEANKAMNYGQRLGEEQSDYESTKEWVAANDHRTRHSHRITDGQVLDFKDRFLVPIFKGGKIQIQIGVDLMDGPGDLHASAGNICNCRCTLSFINKRDESGRLIPKPVSHVRNTVDIE